jgi:hypothetical protein
MQVLSRHKAQAGGLPRLDPVADMAIADPQLKESCEKVAALEKKLDDNPGVGGRPGAARAGLPCA